MPRRKGVEYVPSWWFALRPGMSPGFWVRVSIECKRKGIAKSNRVEVSRVVNLLTPKINHAMFKMLHITIGDKCEYDFN